MCVRTSIRTTEPVLIAADTTSTMDTSYSQSTWNDGELDVITSDASHAWYEQEQGTMKNERDCVDTPPATTTALKRKSVDSETQTPVRRSISADPRPCPDAPARKVAKVALQRDFWMSPGYDIRRDLFIDHDAELMKGFADNLWAVLKIDAIRTSPDHCCIRRLYIGDKTGRHYIEMEFYPCQALKKLSPDLQARFHHERARVHGLSYNPIKRSLPCCKAIIKIKDFIVYNNIETVLFNGGSGIVQDLCNEMCIPCHSIQRKISM